MNAGESMDQVSQSDNQGCKSRGLIIRLAMRPIHARTILGWISQPYQPAH